MSIFVIADLHLSLRVPKPMDIFGDNWSGHEEKIKKDWLEKVKENDLVILPGDFSWETYLENTKLDFGYLNSLPGKKLMLKGNHDYWFSTKTKVEQFLAAEGLTSIYILFNNAYRYEEYTICGTRGWFNEPGSTADSKVLLREAGRLKLSLEAGKKLGGKPLAFLHYPPVSFASSSEELVTLLQEYGVKRCYYGHLHGQSCENAVNGIREGIEYRLISGDYIQFDPEFVA